MVLERHTMWPLVTVLVTALLCVDAVAVEAVTGSKERMSMMRRELASDLSMSNVDANTDTGSTNKILANVIDSTDKDGISVDEGDSIQSDEDGLQVTEEDAMDPMGCWGKINRSQQTFGGPIDLDEAKAMLSSFAISMMKKDNEQRISQQEALSMKVPRCPKYNDAQISSKSFTDLVASKDAANAELKAYLDEQLHGLDKKEPLILATIEGFLLSETLYPHDGRFHVDTTRAEICMNFICGMTRLKLDRRLVIFAVDSHSSEALTSLGSQARVLHHPALLSLVDLAGKQTQVEQRNRMGKLVLPLLLLERGFQVIVSDIDTYWVQDPTQYLMNLGVDMAAMSDFCQNSVNSGFVYYSGSERSKTVLRLALLTKKWHSKTHALYADNDQYLLQCAHAQALVHAGLKSTVLPRPMFSFSCNPDGFVNYKCPSNAGKAATAKPDVKAPAKEQLPYVLHTAGMSGTEVIGTQSMLKTIGFWDVKPGGIWGKAKVLQKVLKEQKSGLKEQQSELKQSPKLLKVLKEKESGLKEQKSGLKEQQSGLKQSPKLLEQSSKPVFQATSSKPRKQKMQKTQSSKRTPLKRSKPRMQKMQKTQSSKRTPLMQSKPQMQKMQKTQSSKRTPIDTMALEDQIVAKQPSNVQAYCLSGFRGKAEEPAKVWQMGRTACINKWHHRCKCTDFSLH